MMPLFKPSSINFTYSDTLFLISIIFIFIFKNKNINFNVFEDKVSTLIYFFGVLLLFSGFSISSIFYGSNINYTTIILQYFMLLVIIPLTLKNSNIKLKKSLLIIMLSMTITILFGVYLYYFTSNISYSIGGRMGSLFKNPNTLAKNISLLIPIIFILIYKYYMNKAWLFFPVFGLGLLLASSFGGIIASFLSLLLVLSFTRQFKTIVKVIIILTISSFFLIGVFGIPEIFEERILSSQNEFELEDAGSFSYKKQLMKNSIKLISENPFIGLGLGNYGNNVSGSSTVHNTYLLIWVEGGLFSIVGLVIIFLSFLMKIIKNYKDQYYFGSTLTVFIIIMLNFLTNVHFYNRYSLITLFLLLTLYTQNDFKYTHGNLSKE